MDGIDEIRSLRKACEDMELENRASIYIILRIIYFLINLIIL